MNTTTFQQPSTVLVEYVGKKPEETDHLYGTNIVWQGYGDVQEVPASAWGRMRKHADVWRLYVPPIEDSTLAPVQEPAAPAAPVAPVANAPADPPADPPAPPVDPQPPAPPAPPTGNDTPPAANSAEPPDPQWRAWARDDLYRLAVEKCLNPHHQLGKDKLLTLLGL